MPEDTIKDDEYAPITRALRGRLKVAALGLAKPMADGLLAECDNIDAIHKALEDANAEMREFCNRLEDAAKKREDVTIFGTDYTALLLDANDVPIHVGDVMKGEKVGGGFIEPFEVVGYIMSNGELEPMDEHGCPRKHKYLHHHHEPTVKDVLREFYVLAVRGKEAHAEDVDEDVLAEYAAKLCLAGDAE